MAGLRMGQTPSGKWTVYLTNNDTDAPAGLEIPVKLTYNGGDEVSLTVKKGVTASVETPWRTEVGEKIDTNKISVTGMTTVGDTTYVVSNVRWEDPVVAKYIRVSSDSITVASGAGSTAQFTIETNVDANKLHVSVDDNDNFTVVRNGNVVTVTAMNNNPGEVTRNAVVTVSDEDGESQSALVSVAQSSGGAPEPTIRTVKIYGSFEQTDISIPGDVYDELILESESDEVMHGDPLSVRALYTTFKTPAATRNSRRGAPIGNNPDDIVIAEEDVTDKCVWEAEGDVEVDDGTVTNRNHNKTRQVATISATYQGKSAQKEVELDANKDGRCWIKITPSGTTEAVENGESIQLELYDCLYDSADAYEYRENITRDEWAVWTIEEGMEYATVLHGLVTNINTDENDKEIVVRASYKFTPDGVDRKTLTMKGTGDSRPRLNISVPRGEPIPRTGGTATIYVDSNLPSWSISVTAVSGYTSPDWFDIGSATGSNCDTRQVNVGIWATQYNKQCRQVKVTVTGGGLESSVFVTQLCSVNPSLSPSGFPGPEGGVAKLHISPGGNINTTFRVFKTNGATGISFDEHVDDVTETGGTCVNGAAVPVSVYVKPRPLNAWSSTRTITFTAEFETIGAKKTGSITQLSAKLKLMNDSDADVMNNMAYDDVSVHELVIDSNVTWEVVEPEESWISASKDGSSLKVQLTKNEGDTRTGTIKLWATANHAKTYEINVRQNGQ